MNELRLDTTVVYALNKEAYEGGKFRFIVNQGGSRSSKTYSIAQLLLYISLTSHNLKITVVRKTLPALKATAMQDFFSILKENNIYDERNHNKTEGTYKIGSCSVAFISIDEPQKIRGRKHDIVWFNEANEIDFEDFKQVNQRTTKCLFLDYNPSDEYHWIYDHVIPRAEAKFIQSTYKDNTFLEPAIIKEIERYKEVDEDYWKVYGLGERSSSANTIYSNYRIMDKALMPEPDEIIYGLDFGFNHPMAMTEIRLKDGQPYIKEYLYETNWTTSDLLRFLRDNIPNKKREIYCDAAEPDRIEELHRAGYNAHPAKKDVEAGIDYCKKFVLSVEQDSLNLIKELRSYKWKTDKNGKILDVPVKINDDLVDSMRYALYTHGIRGSSRRLVTEEDIRAVEREYGMRDFF